MTTTARAAGGAPLDKPAPPAVRCTTRPADNCTHEGFQAVIVETAHLYRWHHLHVRRSIGKGRRWQTTTNRDGWPDLFLWHSTLGFAALEVKVGRDRPTPEQAAVLAELAAAGAATLVAYPRDWDLIVNLLSGVTARSVS